MAIALSPGGSSIYSSPRPSTKLLVATAQGIAHLEREPGGFAWRVTDRSLPGQPDLPFVSAALDTPGTWKKTRFAGARISRSRDGGRSWKALDNRLPDRMRPNIDALCLEDAGSAPTIFAGTTSGEDLHELGRRR